MHTLPKSTFLFAICLSALAGCVDVIGFLHLGGYFVSFMSGNSTRLAINLAHGYWQESVLAGSIIAFFILGSMLGVLVRHAAGKWAVQGVMAFVAGLLAAGAGAYESGYEFMAMICLTLAMGAENAVFQRNGDIVVGLTYMTGTLVKIGQRLGQSILGGASLAWLPYLLLWLGLMAGGLAGTLLFIHFGLHSLWVTAAWAITLTSASVLFRKRFWETA